MKIDELYDVPKACPKCGQQDGFASLDSHYYKKWADDKDKAPVIVEGVEVDEWIEFNCHGCHYGVRRLCADSEAKAHKLVGTH